MRVEYVCHSGGDLLVVNAARCSFGKEKTEFDDKDAKLIAFLAREKHLLPFRHPQITLRLRAPLFVARQLGKHQTGMSWSEESRRYIDSPPEFYWPDKWRKRADNVKQGSSDETVPCILHKDGTPLINLTPQSYAERLLDECITTYDGMLKSGVAPELARMILPQNMMTTWVWTGSLLSYVHMIKERTNVHTQNETRQVAEMVKAILEPLFPVSMKALLQND